MDTEQIFYGETPDIPVLYLDYIHRLSTLYPAIVRYYISKEDRFHESNCPERYRRFIWKTTDGFSYRKALNWTTFLRGLNLQWTENTSICTLASSLLLLQREGGNISQTFPICRSRMLSAAFRRAGLTGGKRRGESVSIGSWN